MKFARGAGAWIVIAIATTAYGDPPTFTDDTWRYNASENLALDGGLAVGFPVALPTGLATGVGAGVSWGRQFVVGARASYASATESSAAWRVTHREVGLRATVGIQHFVGRGLLGVRLALGGTLVHETRLRQQGERAGLMGDALATSANELVPVVNLDAVVGLHIKGPWRIQITGGPALVIDSGARAGWSAALGIAWQP